MMLEFLQMVGLLAVVFAVSMVVSYLVTAKNRRKVTFVPLMENARVRMVGPGGTYRCYFVKRTKKGLVFSAPLQRDRYVPVRVGESMMVQAPVADSLVTFRSSVISRDVETHEFALAHPQRMRQVDRRAEARDRTVEGSIVRVNGEPASLMDLSAGGARIVSNSDLVPGDRVTLDLPEELGSIWGWALESVPSQFGGSVTREFRVRFEEPLSGLSTLRRRHLYLGR
ncbi:hypothetical protein CCB80_04640 [Armatimonadetes bacterium Uphvl-Ar1]|nr:hypothetical protein CCB80_04640 [Armatimonadetes bacterium Uphvl-Ar1]